MPNRTSALGCSNRSQIELWTADNLAAMELLNNIFPAGLMVCLDLSDAPPEEVRGGISNALCLRRVGSNRGYNPRVLHIYFALLGPHRARRARQEGRQPAEAPDAAREPAGELAQPHDPNVREAQR